MFYWMLKVTDYRQVLFEVLLHLTRRCLLTEYAVGWHTAGTNYKYITDLEMLFNHDADKVGIPLLSQS